MPSVTINVGIMKNVNLNVKPIRGKNLPLKVKTTIYYDDQSFCGLEEYMLLYLDGKEARFLTGIKNNKFQLDS